jgi:single-strand DNA-binding protein
MGRLTRDPDLRYTPSGTAVVDINLAINRNFVVAEGDRRQETCFVDVTIWRRLAEVSAARLQRGSPVFVEGHLHLDTWKGPQGEKRSKLRVIAENVQFLDREDPKEEDKNKEDTPEKFEF